MSRPLIVIPARMGSTRFPGKPLATINNISMLRRTAQVAKSVDGADYVVATDHADIVDHCERHDLPVILTAQGLASGSDRALAAAEKMGSKADIIVNLQGDAPFTDPAHIKAVIAELIASGGDMATPYVRLDWEGLDRLRADKEETPFSGTTLIEVNGRALWFSKNIIPAIRKEAQLRSSSERSPVCRHIGLYAYRREALRRYTELSESHYEAVEGLEQLRALENGFSIAVVEVQAPRVSSPGIDTPEDLRRAEGLIAEHGDPFIGPI